MDGSISLRLANEQDIPAILEVSEGIYGGMDYLPLKINQWFKSKARYMFVAEVQGKLSGSKQRVSLMEGKLSTAGHCEYTRNTEDGVIVISLCQES